MTTEREDYLALKEQAIQIDLAEHPSLVLRDIIELQSDYPHREEFYIQMARKQND